MPVTYFGQDTLTPEFFRQWLVDSPPPAVVVDIETISLLDKTVLGFSIATSPDDAFYFRMYPERDREVELVLPLLANPAIAKVFHNAFFDLSCLMPVDMSNNFLDTNVMARLLGYTFTSLADLAPFFGRVATSAKDMLKGKKTMLDFDWMEVAAKCCNDSKVTYTLSNNFWPRVKDTVGEAYFAAEMAPVTTLIKMGQRGIKIDQQARIALEVVLEAEVAYYKSLCEGLGFAPGSNQQVGFMLAKRGNILPFTKTKKHLKVDEDTLEFLSDPMAALVINYRKASKLLGTYIKPMEGKERMTTRYGYETSVGRLNSADRNIQNVPDRARCIFLPDSGCYTTGDFSQEHLRFLMHVAGDREMRRVYEEGEYGGDIHQFTAEKLGISRKLAKLINYAIAYGATPYTIALHIKTKDIRKCSKFLDDWFRLFRDTAEWIKAAQEYGVRNGWSLPTLFGRRIKLPIDENIEGIKRKAVNYPILGSDGEVMKRALVICARKELPLAITVHDSITCDGDIEFPIEELETIAPVRVPFEVKRTLRWE